MAAEDDEEKTEEEVKPKKKGGMMLYIIIGVVVLLFGGGAAFFLLGGKKAETDEDAVVDVKLETVELKPFIVNLADNTSYLKVTLLLEYDPTLIGLPKGLLRGGGGIPVDILVGNLPGNLQSREVMIRDAIINVLASKTRQELLTVEGREQLKEEIVEAANDATGLDEAPIVGVYFIEFVIQ